MADKEQSKTAIVTGATGAIGQAIAYQMAAKRYRLVIIARDEDKGQQTVRKIIETTGNPNVSYKIADLSRRSDIQTLAQCWVGPLHVLINNAAVTPRIRQETPEGIELQFATNVLGYFWMTEAFRDILHQSAPSQIVDIASYWAGGLDLDDLEFKRRRYSNGSAYRQSKQANRMLAVAWAKKLKDDGITINGCHPGDVNSQLSNNLGFGGSQSPDQGAETPVWLATEPIGIQVTGKYFEHLRESHCQFSQDITSIDRLFEICKSYSR